MSWHSFFPGESVTHEKLNDLDRKLAVCDLLTDKAEANFQRVLLEPEVFLSFTELQMDH